MEAAWAVMAFREPKKARTLKLPHNYRKIKDFGLRRRSRESSWEPLGLFWGPHGPSWGHLGPS
eukprot:5998653-Pyramimonas_sp.AAC.1